MSAYSQNSTSTNFRQYGTSYDPRYGPGQTDSASDRNYNATSYNTQNHEDGIYGDSGVNMANYSSTDIGMENADGTDSTTLNPANAFVLDEELIAPAPFRRTIQDWTLSENIYNHLRYLDLQTMNEMEPDDERYKEIPSRYHSAYPLDDPKIPKGTLGAFGFPTSTYKVVDSRSNHVYLLRRMDKVRTSPAIIEAARSKWIPLSHPCIVKLHEITSEKGALFVSYDYYPGAETLRQRFMDLSRPNYQSDEQLIWRILLQLLSAVRYVHRKNCAIRMISPVSVLYTSGGVARFNSVGIPDIVEFESRRPIKDLQQDDFVRLGYLVLSLASKSLISNKNVDTGFSFLQANFSDRLIHAVNNLLTGDLNSCASIAELGADILLDEYVVNINKCDSLKSHLSHEYENDRMFRLMLQLGLVNERPDLLNPGNSSNSWSETGDQYVLKLFRDYVFHQHDENGKPILDMGHITASLNKLDIGSTEQIILCTRDKKDLIILSFNDVKRCLENSIKDLSKQAVKQTTVSDSYDKSMNRASHQTAYSNTYRGPIRNTNQRSSKANYYTSDTSGYKGNASTLNPSAAMREQEVHSSMSASAPVFTPNSTRPVNSNQSNAVTTGYSNTYSPSNDYYPKGTGMQSSNAANYSSAMGSDASMDDLTNGMSAAGIGLKPTAQEWTPPSNASNKFDPNKYDANTFSAAAPEWNPQRTNTTNKFVTSTNPSKPGGYGQMNESMASRDVTTGTQEWSNRNPSSRYAGGNTIPSGYSTTARDTRQTREFSSGYQQPVSYYPNMSRPPPNPNFQGRGSNRPPAEYREPSSMYSSNSSSVSSPQRNVSNSMRGQMNQQYY